MKKTKNYDENYKYDIKDRDYFVSKFKDFITEGVDTDVDQVDDMIHQLSSLFTEMETTKVYQDKAIVNKFSKLYKTAKKDLEILRDFIKDEWE
jgi:hypothetical protein